MVDQLAAMSSSPFRLTDSLWTRLPSEARSLPADVLDKLEQALFWAACGQYDLSERLFDDLTYDDPHPIILLEKAEILRRRGYRHRELRVLSDAAAALQLHPLGKQAQHYTELCRAHALIRTEGRLSSALDTARRIKDELRKSADLEQLADITVQCSLRYYAIIETCRTCSSWVTDTDEYIFQRTPTLGGEAAALATRLEAKGNYAASYMAYVVALQYEADGEEKRKILHLITQLVAKMSTPSDPAAALQAATYNLRVAEYCRALVGTDWETRIDDFLAARPPVGEALRLLAIFQSYGPALQRLIQAGLPNEQIRPTTWQSLAPVVSLDYDVVVARCSALSSLPLTRAQCSTYAARAGSHGHRAKQRAFLFEAVTAAQKEYTGDPSAATQTSLAAAERAALSFEESDSVQLGESLGANPEHATSNVINPSEAFFLASTLYRVLQKPRILRWRAIYERCKGFLDRHESFDAPVQRAGLYDVLSQAAAAMGQSKTIMRYDERYKMDLKGCPKVHRDPSAQLQFDPLCVAEIVHPLNQTLDWSTMFHGCINVMSTWESEQRKEDEPLNLATGTTLDSVSERLRTDAEKVLGSFQPPTQSHLPSVFKISPWSHWEAWLNPLEEWLTDAGEKALESCRMYVLHKLATIRCHFAGIALITLQAQDGKLPPLEAVVDRNLAEERRCKIVDKVASHAPTVLSLGDRYLARHSRISTEVTLSFYPKALALGHINEESLRSAQEQSEALIQDRHELGDTVEEYTSLCQDAVLRWRRYALQLTLFNFDNLERAERLRDDRRWQTSTITMAEKLRNIGSIEFLTQAGTVKDTDFTAHIGVALTAAFDLVETSAAGSRNGSLAYLSLWIQRQKCRSLMEVMAQAIEPPASVIQAAKSLPIGKKLIEEESVLSRDYLNKDITLERKIQAKQALDKCRRKMRREPALRELVSLREAAPPTLEEIQLLLQSLADDRGTPCIFIDFFQAEPRRHPGNICVLVHRAHRLPELRSVEGLEHSHCQMWHQKHINVQHPLTISEQAQADLNSLSVLIEPIEELTEPAETLIICPSGILHSIPLHAMPTGGRPLIQRNPVAYCQSFAHFKLSVERSSDVLQSRNIKAAVIHGVSQQYRQGEGLKDLSANVRKSTKVAQNTARQWGTRVLRDDDLNKEAVSIALQGASMVVYEGHAHYDAKAPIDSALVLIDPPPDKLGLDETKNKFSKQLFSAQAFFKVGLQSPAFVLNLGCQSGVTNVNRGDVVGLNTAIHYAGASSIVSALWRIDDDDAADYAEAFFDVLKQRTEGAQAGGASNAEQDHKPRDTTLNLVNVAQVHQQAVLRLMGNDTQRAPYHWAAFVLNGSFLYPRALCMPPGKEKKTVAIR